MRRIFFGIASAIALTGSASAADMYTGGGAGRLKDDFVPVNSWTGFYAGVNGGYAWNTGSELVGAYELLCMAGVQNCTPATLSKKAPLSAEGGFGGAQIGYNRQHDRFVFGIEADIQGAAIDGSATVTPYSAMSAHGSTSLDWFGTLRARAGLLVSDAALLYATGGFAYGGVQDRLTTTTSLGSKSSNEVAAGYALGGGVEYAFNPKWSAKAEYQYLDLGTGTLILKDFNSSAELDSHHSYNTVRLGLNYHIAPTFEPLK